MQVEFEAEIWRAEAEAAWRFVTLPRDIAASIRQVARAQMSAFGSLRVEATLGQSIWRTSLFFDTKRGSFLLPVKAAVRRKEGVKDGASVRVRVEVLI